MTQKEKMKLEFILFFGSIEAQLAACDFNSLIVTCELNQFKLDAGVCAGRALKALLDCLKLTDLEPYKS